MKQTNNICIKKLAVKLIKKVRNNTKQITKNKAYINYYKVNSM